MIIIKILMMGKKTKDRQPGLCEIKKLLNHRGDSEIKKNTLQTKSGVLRKPKTMEASREN